MRREIMEGCSKLLLHITTAVEVSSGVVSRQCATVRPIVELVQSQCTLSRACGTFSDSPRLSIGIHMCGCHTTAEDMSHEVLGACDCLLREFSSCRQRATLGDVVGA